MEGERPFHGCGPENIYGKKSAKDVPKGGKGAEAKICALCRGHTWEIASCVLHLGLNNARLIKGGTRSENSDTARRRRMR